MTITSSHKVVPYPLCQTKSHHLPDNISQHINNTNSISKQLDIDNSKGKVQKGSNIMRVRKWIEIVNMIETRFKKISIKLKAGRILLILIEIAMCGTI